MYAWKYVDGKRLTICKTDQGDWLALLFQPAVSAVVARCKSVCRDDANTELAIQLDVHFMKLIELFLPCQRPSGEKVEAVEFERVEQTLTQMFGGATAYRRAATGHWKRSAGDVEVDEITVVEVVTDSFDRQWWCEFRRELLNRFQQDELLVRVTEVDLL
tara:strand:- start:13757 stop:14236 length:480 start_codon:yes stop_codon:yes gene_type:complete